MQIQRKGMLLIVSGPSGAGKGTLTDMLMAEDDSIVFSISATTRAPREHEIPDVHYHFLTPETFSRLVQEDAFLEHAQVHGNCYGTLKSEVEERLAQGQNVLLDIDTQGALNVMKKMPDCVSVFIYPPSMQTLRQRLIDRGTETSESLALRLRNAWGEVAQAGHYQYVIVNDDKETAYRQLRSIVNAEKQRGSRFSVTLEEN